jgi:hypothetical protein
MCTDASKEVRCAGLPRKGGGVLVYLEQEDAMASMWEEKEEQSVGFEVGSGTGSSGEDMDTPSSGAE